MNLSGKYIIGATTSRKLCYKIDIIDKANLNIRKMKLKRFLLRYHPPGIILEYLKRSGEIETKSIDLLNLTPG